MIGSQVLACATPALDPCQRRPCGANLQATYLHLYLICVIFMIIMQK
jgi:hypothetical protein